MINLVRIYKNFAVDLSLLVTAGLCVIFGQINFLYVIFAILMHELAHYAGAILSGNPPGGFVLHGFGVEMCFNSGGNNNAVMFTAACGPLMSVMLAALGYKMKNFAFFSSNAAIAAINFLPVMPLDGGQIFYCLLSNFFSRAKCRSIIKASGIFTGSLIAVCGLYILCISGFNFSLMYIGIFIIVSNTGQLYNPVIESTNAKIADYRRCNVFIVDETDFAVKAANMLPSNAVGAVRNSDGKINGFVTPCFLYRCAEKNGSDIIVKDTFTE